ncbi:DUF1415 domain-containing protein [Microbulbifer agarilyticus]|uniref:DUF1415 domain-containing protein n=1 Tax=Microbulbifer agarilyticus TaxID=260552 RepID=UPI001C942638|nr:DUF1415 domain-containing protein [Microbulbifer agarilyticus]MBY6189116.1 DUF1415 domain-containing protein [Microbulbifer agarilyticus]MBY6212184.1 DUF1415 domain-containing protein [Microbulbifer agarilyticus]
MTDSDPIVAQVERWLQDVVVGLNLCPFARKPLRAGQIRFVVSEAAGDKCNEVLLEELLQEFQVLDRCNEQEVETTLLILPTQLRDFHDYNFFLDDAEWLLKRQGYEGTYQIASFHPHYQFADTEPEDPENLTNRSPYPILHILREASMERGLKNYPDPESIPHNNIVRVESLSDDEKRALFPYLFASQG